jgi:hypothetical protein
MNNVINNFQLQISLNLVDWIGKSNVVGISDTNVRNRR